MEDAGATRQELETTGKVKGGLSSKAHRRNTALLMPGFLPSETHAGLVIYRTVR